MIRNNLKVLRKICQQRRLSKDLIFILSVIILQIFALKLFPHILKILSFRVSLYEFYKNCKNTLNVSCSCYLFSSTNCYFFSRWNLTTENERDCLPIFLPYIKAMSVRSVSVLLASRATLWVRCLASLFVFFFKSSVLEF